jgi:long-subunit fatty acid transport protein
MRHILLAALVLSSGTAFASGLMRPNTLGARAMGMGGGHAAIADDPTAVWTNPAGPAFFGENVAYLGGELIITQRRFEPAADSPIGMQDPTKVGQVVAESGAPTFIPVIGLSTRFGFGRTKPTRFALSLLAYDAFGGSISFTPGDVNGKGLLQSQILNFEIAPALSFQVTDVLAIGAALRIGITSFSVNDVEPAFSAKLSMTGVGIGGTLGILMRPHKMVSIGATYRTPLSAKATGGGDLIIGTSTTPENKDASLQITWPQSFSLALAIKPHWRVLIHAQGDWYGWSSVQNLTIAVAGILPQIRNLRFTDTFQAHLGLQVTVVKQLQLRAGYAFETPASPETTIRRENIDGPKHLLSCGAGLHLFWKIWVDLAFEALLPVGEGLRIAQTPDSEAGLYHSNVYVLELAGQIRF